MKLLDLLIMKCMKNVTDSQQILKSRSYKKIMNDSSRDEWLKIIVRIDTVDHWIKSPKKGTMLGLTVPAATGLYKVHGLFYHPPKKHDTSPCGRNITSPL
jgi:hypothetical protein